MLLSSDSPTLLILHTISKTKGSSLSHGSLNLTRARLQYEVAQQPRLLAHLPTPLFNLLQIALDSHRFALKIDQDNPDLLLYASLTCGKDNMADCTQ